MVHTQTLGFLLLEQDICPFLLVGQSDTFNFNSGILGQAGNLDAATSRELFEELE